MNKAFVREAEATDEFCPRCGAKGEAVGGVTLAAQLEAAVRARFADHACFCPSPRCEVVYFDSLQRVVLTGELLAGVYPKDPAAPICPCYGFTCDDIDLDVSEGSVARTRAHVQRVQQNPGRCGELAANGRSCVAHVQRYYMQAKSGRG